MKNNANIFDSWFNMVNSMTDSWKNMAGKWTEEQKENSNDINQMSSRWFENYQDVIGKQWEPYIRQMQESSLNYFYLNFFNPLLYRRYMDQTTALHKTMDNLSSTNYTMGEQIINSTKTMMSMYERTMPSLDNFSKIYPHTISGWYNDIFKTIKRSMVPFFDMPSDLKIADVQHHFKTIEYLVRYANKSARLKYLLTSKALCAWEKVMKEVHSSARDGKPLSGFNEFYTEWSQTNEKEFENLIHTKEFVMLQEELLRIKSELTKRFEKNMELIVQPLPVVAKSQMEEVYQANHDLKKRINKLEKEMAN
jgi:hypothetical protein